VYQSASVDSSSLGTIAVIDGCKLNLIFISGKLLYTPFKKHNVPPPMSHSETKHDAPVVNCAFGPFQKDDQIAILLNGKNAMPGWKSTLSDTEIAAVITYTRNTWSNKAADNIVQPAEVLAARK
jgi:hypothetical protein